MQTMASEQQLTAEIKIEDSEVPHDHTGASINNNDLNDLDHEEPPLKRQKVKSEEPEATSNTMLPVPANSVTESELKQEELPANIETPKGSDGSRSNSTFVTQQTLPIATVQTTTAAGTTIEVVKHTSDSKHTIPTQPSKADLVRQSGRSVEDIIDGSDLRKFLNKGLTEYIVKGLDEIVELWEKGKFNFDGQEPSKEVLKRKVALQFADIIKQLAEK